MLNKSWHPWFDSKLQWRRLPVFILQGFFFWLHPEYLSPVNIYFSRYTYSLTIPFQRKIIQMEQKNPTPKQSLRFFNPAYSMGEKAALWDPAYWDAILIQGHGKIFFHHLIAALERFILCVYPLLKEFKHPEHGSGSIQPHQGSLWALAIIYIHFETNALHSLPQFHIRCGNAFIVCADSCPSSLKGLRCFALPPVWKTEWAGE